MITREFNQTRLLMRFFIASEAIFFLALLIGFVYYRSITNLWQESGQYLDIKQTLINSVFLFASSASIILARKALLRYKQKQLIVNLILTIILGSTFLIGQILEYRGLLEKEISINKNIFGSAFFTVTGFHGFHVFIGLVILSVILILASLGDFSKGKSHASFVAAERYWHFVDVVWIFVLVIVYLMPIL